MNKDFRYFPVTLIIALIVHFKMGTAAAIEIFRKYSLIIREKRTADTSYLSGATAVRALNHVITSFWMIRLYHRFYGLSIVSGKKIYEKIFIKSLDKIAYGVI